MHLLRRGEVCGSSRLTATLERMERNECVIAHSPEAIAVLEDFAAGTMGSQCELLDRAALARRVPMARLENVTGALWSPHELRVEPRIAIPALEAYLANELGVTVRRGVYVNAVRAPEIQTSDGVLRAENIIVAPGPDLVSLFPEVHARRGVRLCKLQMLRLAPQPPGWRLPASIMSDYALIRYRGFSAQQAAASLRPVLQERAPKVLAFGIHLIVVQNSDGSLIVGDSHEYGAMVDPFYSMEIEDTILELAYSTLHIPNADAIERWIRAYPQSEQCEWLVDAPDDRTRVVQVTTGNGMSTAFGLAEEVIDKLVAKPAAASGGTA
jgi:D-hydroxyproline dehydrogenase subunit beta